MDARSLNNFAFRSAAAHGHVKVLCFLCRWWGLTSKDARSLNNFAFRAAAANGHVNVLNFMQNKLGLTFKNCWAKAMFGTKTTVELASFVSNIIPFKQSLICVPGDRSPVSILCKLSSITLSKKLYLISYSKACSSLKSNGLSRLFVTRMSAIDLDKRNLAKLTLFSVW